LEIKVSNELESVIGENLITLKEYSSEEISTILQIGHRFRENNKKEFRNIITGKNIALLFELPSLRTRSAFSIAIKEIGGFVEYYSPNDIHRESLPDIARVMSKFFDLIIYRAKSHENIETLTEYSEVPVINAMSPICHPVQGLTDILTIQTKFKNKHKVKIINIGDNRSNVSNSLLICAVKSGYDYIAVGPENFLPDSGLVAELNQISEQTGSQISLTDDINSELLMNAADVVYTDAWTLVGRTKDENNQRYEKLEPYRVTTEIMGRICNESGIYMHCLPAAHDSEHPLEVTNNVFESTASVVFEQAANKLHIVKALTTLILDRY
jgi:ornithine carbamoyltransferase